MESGIYLILNLVNYKVYVGSSVYIAKRFNTHKRQLRNGVHPNAHLQAAWRKYGANAFVFEVLDLLEIESLKERETYWINELDAIACGYNIALDTVSPMRGRKHKASTLKLMSSQRQGSLHPLYGKGHSEETKRKISESKKGQPSPNKGKKLTQAQRQHLAAINTGKRHSKETRRKMSEAQKRRHSEN